MRLQLAMIMKNKGWVISIVVLIIATGCLPKQQNASAVNLKKHVETLCGFGPDRSLKNVQTLNESADYIFNSLKQTGITVNNQHYQAKENQVRNIIAEMGPTGGKSIIIGAHYDSVSGSPGADDNASAVAVLLEIARLLAAQKDQLNVHIIFAAYTLEEPPWFGGSSMGSYQHAQSLNADEIDYMICLEMLGYYSDEEGSQDYPQKSMLEKYPNKGNFLAIASDQNSQRDAKKINRYFRKKGAIPTVQLACNAKGKKIFSSDHINYYHFGMKAIMLTDTAWFRNKNYHKPSDKPETLDYTKMEMISTILSGYLLSQ